MELSDLVTQVSAITQKILNLSNKIQDIEVGKGHNSNFKSELETFSSASKTSIQELTQVTGRVSCPIKESFFENLIDQTSGSNMNDLKSGLDEFDGKMETKKKEFAEEITDLKSLVNSINSTIDQLKKELTD